MANEPNKMVVNAAVKMNKLTTDEMTAGSVNNVTGEELEAMKGLDRNVQEQLNELDEALKDKLNISNAVVEFETLEETVKPQSGQTLGEIIAALASGGGGGTGGVGVIGNTPSDQVGALWYE